MIKKLFVAAAMVFAATSAGAAVIDYTGSQTNPGGPTLSCDALGILNTGCSVTYNDAGLGVDGFGFGKIPDTTPGLIDGFPIFSSERLLLDFGVKKVWNAITFGVWDRDDDVRLTIDTGESFTYGPGESDGTVGLSGIVSRSLMVTAYGQLFQDGALKCRDPECRYDGLTVAAIDVSPVPLPAGGWLLIAGLGGLAAMRSRKRATA